MAIQQKSSTRTMPYLVRPMHEEDVHTCARIEGDAFPTLFPPTSFRRELKNKLASYLVVCLKRVGGEAAPLQDAAGDERPGLLGRILCFAPWRGSFDKLRTGSAAPAAEGEPVGFIGLWYMADEAHVVSVGVDAQHRGKGVGELLLIAAIEQAMARNASVVTLEVRQSNEVAKNLYKKYGLTERGLRKGYYSENREDAVIMTSDPVADQAYRERFDELRAAHEALYGTSARTLENVPLAPEKRLE
ncbi:MAG: ribosomal-protein-alanine N-acetyltransferase [SAR202 cluster bacterium]|nr:ribosomal-protein-alanine N-acetyltransferase [SAR202 cluster bacterium]